MTDEKLTPGQLRTQSARIAAWRKADAKKAEHLQLRGWVCIPPEQIEALTPNQAHMLTASMAGLGPSKPCGFPRDPGGEKHNHMICTIAAQEWTP